MSKHVGVLIIIINYILLSAIVGGSADCKNMHRVNNNTEFLFLLLYSKQKLYIREPNAPRGLEWDRTPVSTVQGRKPTARVMSWPIHLPLRIEREVRK